MVYLIEMSHENYIFYKAVYYFDSLYSLRFSKNPLVHFSVNNNLEIITSY